MGSFYEAALCVILNRLGNLSYTFKPDCTSINPQVSVLLQIKNEREIETIALEHKIIRKYF